jgi:hypothetical protein
VYEDGGDVEDSESSGAASRHAELERAIASVPGVTEARVTRSGSTGRSRLRIRLAPGEDAEAASWAIAATLRERFGIALDPDDIRPRVGPGDEEGAAPETVTAEEAAAGEAPVPQETVAPAVASAETAPRAEVGSSGDRAEPARPETTDRSAGTDGNARSGEPARTAELIATRRRLADAVRDALAGLEQATAELATVPGAGTGTEDGAPELSAVPAAPADDAAVATQTDGGPSAAALAQGDRSRFASERRARIRHLDTRVDTDDVRVTATLEHDGVAARGQAVGFPTSHGVLRAVAEATLAALRELAGPDLVIGLDRVGLELASTPSIATVVVSMIADRGEEQLLGSSIVRGDPERAVMRATLDACNRRVAAYLATAAAS